MSKQNIGSSIDDFMRGEGIFEEAQAQAVQEVVAWKREQERLLRVLRVPPSRPLR